MRGLDRENLDLALESMRDFAKQKLPLGRLLEWLLTVVAEPGLAAPGWIAS